MGSIVSCGEVQGPPNSVIAVFGCLHPLRHGSDSDYGVRYICKLCTDMSFAYPRVRMRLDTDLEYENETDFILLNHPAAMFCSLIYITRFKDTSMYSCSVMKYWAASKAL